MAMVFQKSFPNRQTRSPLRSLKSSAGKRFFLDTPSKLC